MDLPASLVSSSFTQRSAVVHTNTNSVIETDHGKFLLVIKNLEDRIVCCAINSIRYSQSFDSQISILEEDQPAITPEDLPALEHVSYVNCSTIFEIETSEFQKKLTQGVFKPKGHLSDAAMAHVLRAGQKCKVLRKFQQDYFR